MVIALSSSAKELFTPANTLHKPYTPAIKRLPALTVISTAPQPQPSAIMVNFDKLYKRVKNKCKGKKPSYTGPRFRFLDLPKELRLMVYEFLPTKTRHHKLCFMKGRDPGTNSEEYQEYVILVIRSLPVQLLRTCKMINYEVVAILKPKLDSLASTVPQMILSCDFLTKDTSAHSFGGADYGHNVIRRVLDAAQRLVGEEYVSAPLTEEDIESFGPRWPEPPDAFTVDEADTAALVQFIRHAGRYLKSVVENPQIALGSPVSMVTIWGEPRTLTARILFNNREYPPETYCGGMLDYRMFCLTQNIGAGHYCFEYCFLDPEEGSQTANLPYYLGRDDPRVWKSRTHLERALRKHQHSMRNRAAIYVGDCISQETWDLEWTEGERL